MSNNIEMIDLSQSRRAGASAEAAKRDVGTDENESIQSVDGTISLWAWSSAVTFVTITYIIIILNGDRGFAKYSLAAFSLCLLIFPRFLLFLTEASGGRGTLTSLEKYLALLLGVVLGTIAVTIISAVRCLATTCV